MLSEIKPNVKKGVKVMPNHMNFVSQGIGVFVSKTYKPIKNELGMVVGYEGQPGRTFKHPAPRKELRRARIMQRKGKIDVVH